MQDFLKYYDLETYLFEQVGCEFRSRGKLEPLDFFLILHWKSPRAKTKNRDKLKDRAGSFQLAVQKIGEGLTGATSSEERLRILITEWNLRLPTATAILTVLYPNFFTVYDVRVREQLGLKEINLAIGWDATWRSYLEYKNKLSEAVPGETSLRNKDRYLWGKSLYEDAAKQLCE